MKSIIEYIMLNYTWFLGGTIIILLAIIGSYADKTNFGQGKTKKLEEKKEDEIKLENMEVNSKESKEEDIYEKKQVIDTKEEILEKTSKDDHKNVIDNPDEKKENFEETFEKFDKEFNELLPKKEIIDDELLDEIDNLSLDKTQKLKLSDIPDLDDVELPKIKSLRQEDEDIWKF